MYNINYLKNSLRLSILLIKQGPVEKTSNYGANYRFKRTGDWRVMRGQLCIERNRHASERCPSGFDSSDFSLQAKAK